MRMFASRISENTLSPKKTAVTKNISAAKKFTVTTKSVALVKHFGNIEYPTWLARPTILAENSGKR